MKPAQTLEESIQNLQLAWQAVAEGRGNRATINELVDLAISAANLALHSPGTPVADLIRIVTLVHEVTEVTQHRRGELSNELYNMLFSLPTEVQTELLESEVLHGYCILAYRFIYPFVPKGMTEEQLLRYVTKHRAGCVDGFENYHDYTTGVANLVPPYSYSLDSWANQNSRQLTEREFDALKTFRSITR